MRECLQVIIFSWKIGRRSIARGGESVVSSVVWGLFLWGFSLGDQLWINYFKKRHSSPKASHGCFSTNIFAACRKTANCFFLRIDRATRRGVRFTNPCFVARWWLAVAQESPGICGEEGGRSHRSGEICTRGSATSDKDDESQDLPVIPPFPFPFHERLASHEMPSSSIHNV
jgi:hypothetical protein